MVRAPLNMGIVLGMLIRLSSGNIHNSDYRIFAKGSPSFSGFDRNHAGSIRAASFTDRADQRADLTIGFAKGYLYHYLVLLLSSITKNASLFSRIVAQESTGCRGKSRGKFTIPFFALLQ